MRLFCRFDAILLTLVQLSKSHMMMMMMTMVQYCLLTNRFSGVEFVHIHRLMLEQVPDGYLIVQEVRGCVVVKRTLQHCCSGTLV